MSAWMIIGDILRKTEVSFVSFSCIVQILWVLCEYQVIIEANRTFICHLAKKNI